MKAKVIFINEKELAATGNQYALASGVCNEHFDSVYLRLDDLIEYIRQSQDAEAETMIQIQEDISNGNLAANTTGSRAVWRAFNFLLSELRTFNNR